MGRKWAALNVDWWTFGSILSSRCPFAAAECLYDRFEYTSGGDIRHRSSLASDQLPTSSNSLLNILKTSLRLTQFKLPSLSANGQREVRSATRDFHGFELERC
jgi:hypothetical protein